MEYECHRCGESARVKYYDEVNLYLCPNCALHEDLVLKISCVDCKTNCCDPEERIDDIECNEHSCFCYTCDYIRKGCVIKEKESVRTKELAKVSAILKRGDNGFDTIISKDGMDIYLYCNSVVAVYKAKERELVIYNDVYTTEINIDTLKETIA